MKKIIISLFLISLLIVSQNSNAQWVQMANGMGVDRNVASFASNSSYVFAGLKHYGIYRSTNNGTVWAIAGLDTLNVWVLTTNGNNIFAGTEHNGIFLSTNNGTNWTQTALNNPTVYSFVISGNNIFAGTTYTGVYLSTNNGTSWSQTALNNQHVFSLAILGNNIFAGTVDSGIYLSTNNGTSWSKTALNNNLWVYTLAVIGNNIFAGTDTNGVYLSTNNGTTWTQTSLNNKSVISLEVSGNNIFAGSDSGVYISTNNGTNWIQKNQGFSGISLSRSLLIANNYIFLGTRDSSVWRRPLSEMIGIQNISSEIPSSFSLSQNYPNPFNPKTVINFQLPKSNFVTLKIYDILGREVATLVNEQLKVGKYQVDWDGSNYSSGMYFYKFTSDNYSETKRMILVK